MSNNDNFRVSGASTEVGFALTDGTGSGPGPGSGMGSGSGVGSGPGSGCPSGKLIKNPSIEHGIIMRENKSNYEPLFRTVGATRFF